MSLSDKKNLAEAAKKGIFYLKTPESCRKYLEEAIKFGYSFPNDEKLKEYSDGYFGGYHEREHSQIESFYVEKRDWKKVFSPELQKLATQMDQMTKTLLTMFLDHIELPKELRQKATGNLTSGDGQVHLSFNHYRPEKDAMGLKEHRDFGFLSILFIEKSGLEALVDGKWIGVPPLNDRFVVVIGRAFELLANNTEKLSGSWHRVRKLAEERISISITCDNDRGTAVSKFYKDTNILETEYTDYQEYLKSCFEETYSPE